MARDDDGETPALFKELDEDNEAHMRVFRAAKAFRKAKADRDAVLTTAKDKVDTAEQKLIGLMHEAKLTKFSFKGVKAELLDGREKAKVDLEPQDDEAEADVVENG